MSSSKKQVSAVPDGCVSSGNRPTAVPSSSRSIHHMHVTSPVKGFANANPPTPSSPSIRKVHATPPMKGFQGANVNGTPSKSGSTKKKCSDTTAAQMDGVLHALQVMKLESHQHQLGNQVLQSPPRSGKKNTPSKPRLSSTPTKDTWMAQYQKLVVYKEKHQDTDVPRQYPDDKSFGAWVHRQRSEYKNFLDKKKSALNREKVDLLRELDFNCGTRYKTWTNFVEDLEQYCKTNKHCNVTYAEQPKLAKWLDKQREYKRLYDQGLFEQTDMCEERILRLESIEGFEWSTPSTTTTTTTPSLPPTPMKTTSKPEAETTTA